MTLSRLRFFLIGLVVAFIGCGKSDKPADGKVHIKLVHFYVDQKDHWQHDVVETFEQQHPNIAVDVEAIPFGLYTTKILSSAASGEPLGDVVVIDDWFGQELFKQNLTIPIDSLFERDFKRDSFFTQFFTVWKKGNVESGPLMAMPAAGGVTALFYNKDIFDKAGMKYPDSTWTYDDFHNAARKLTNNASDPNEKVWGVLLDDGINTGIDTYIYSNGGAILSDDKSKSMMADPKTIAVVQSYVDMVQKEHVAPPPDPSVSVGQKFMLGHAAMMLQFDVAKTELAHAKFKWDLCAPPKGAGGLQDRQNGQAFGITRSSSHPTESWELVKWIVTLPTKHGVNDLFNSAMPVYKPLAYSNEFMTGEPTCDRRALLNINSSGKVFTLITPGWQEWRDHGFIPNMQDMLAGRKSVPDGCKAIDQKINEVLQRSR
jgi:multiple sugar transport system substrate-binding protein